MENHPLNKLPKITGFNVGDILFYSEYDGKNEWTNYANSVCFVKDIKDGFPILQTLFFTQNNGASFIAMGRNSDEFTDASKEFESYRFLNGLIDQSSLVSDVNNLLSV